MKNSLLAQIEEKNRRKEMAKQKEQMEEMRDEQRVRAELGINNPNNASITGDFGLQNNQAAAPVVQQNRTAYNNHH